MANKYIIKNAIITDGVSRLMDNGAIMVDDGKIAALDPENKLSDASAEIIDAGGRIVIPGLANPHHHLYSRFAVGLSPLGPADKLSEILNHLWWPLDRALDEETVYYSALSGIIDSIKYGVTTVFDHHASNSFVKGSLNTIQKAFQEAGIKGVLAYEVSDREGKDIFREQVEENVDFYQKNQNNANLKGMMGLHANFTLSRDSLQFLRKVMPEGMAIHTHCGEGKEDFDFCVEDGFAGPVDRLNAFGLIDAASFLIHCIHLSEKDFRIINEKNPVVVSNPESNANNGVGVMNTEKIRNYVIGTDGMSGNIIGSHRSHFLRRNGNVDNPLGKLFQNTSQLVHSVYPDSGGLEPGKRADIAVLDYIPETPVKLDNLFFHLIMGFGAQQTWMTMANGKILFKEGKIQQLDETALKADFQKAAKKLHRRFYE